MEWFAAARDGDLPALQRQHAQSAEPSALLTSRQPGSSSAGHTALHWAAAGGHAEIAEWLLDAAESGTLLPYYWLS